MGGKTCGQLCESPEGEGHARSAIVIFILCVGNATSKRGEGICFVSVDISGGRTKLCQTKCRAVGLSREKWVGRKPGGGIEPTDNMWEFIKYTRNCTAGIGRIAICTTAGGGGAHLGAATAGVKGSA